MHVVLIILAILLGVVGIIGSVVPGIPGPPISWDAMATRRRSPPERTPTRLFFKASICNNCNKL